MNYDKLLENYPNIKELLEANGITCQDILKLWPPQPTKTALSSLNSRGSCVGFSHTYFAYEFAYGPYSHHYLKALDQLNKLIDEINQKQSFKEITISHEKLSKIADFLYTIERTQGAQSYYIDPSYAQIQYSRKVYITIFLSFCMLVIFVVLFLIMIKLSEGQELSTGNRIAMYLFAFIPALANLAIHFSLKQLSLKQPSCPQAIIKANQIKKTLEDFKYYHTHTPRHSMAARKLKKDSFSVYLLQNTENLFHQISELQQSQHDNRKHIIVIYKRSRFRYKILLRLAESKYYIVGRGCFKNTEVINVLQYKFNNSSSYYQATSSNSPICYNQPGLDSASILKTLLQDSGFDDSLGQIGWRWALIDHMSAQYFSNKKELLDYIKKIPWAFSFNINMDRVCISKQAQNKMHLNSV